MDLGIPPLDIQNALESSPPKFQILTLWNGRFPLFGSPPLGGGDSRKHRRRRLGRPSRCPCPETAGRGNTDWAARRGLPLSLLSLFSFSSLSLLSLFSLLSLSLSLHLSVSLSVYLSMSMILHLSLSLSLSLCLCLYVSQGGRRAGQLPGLR